MPARRRDWSHGLKIYGPAVLLVSTAFAVAFQFIQPAPPARLVLAAGEPGGAYHASALAYRDILGREGVAVEVLETAGAVSNLELLRTREADAAFVQGGVGNPVASADLRSLGSLYYEPLWLFHRDDIAADRLPSLRGRRVAIGADGSGTQALVRQLLTENGLADDAGDWLALGGAEAAAALAAREVDAVFLVAAPTAPLVRALLTRPGVAVASFARAEAYARRHRFLTTLILPEGAVDLARNVPKRPIRLLAPAAALVASPNLHPALIGLLLQAAREVHGSGGWFEAAGQFPSAAHTGWPLSAEARRYYDYGPPLLQRYLPFWAASLVDRLKVMLLPLLVLLLPLLKVMPPIYTWRMRSRVYRWYRELETVDAGLPDDAGAAERAVAARELDRLEDEVRRVDVPLSFAGQLYHLRQHIEYVRRRVRTG